MTELLTLVRAELLANYETRINFLRRRLRNFQGTSPEAQHIQEQIYFLQCRRNHLEDHYKEIDDLREEAAALRATAREIRAELATRVR